MPTRYGRTSVFVVVVGRVGVIALDVPPPCRGFVELRVREQAEPDDPGGVAVVGARLERLAVDGAAARSNPHARVFRGVLERIGRAPGLPLVEPQPHAIRIRPRGLLEARLVDQAEVLPPVLTTAVRQSGRVAGTAVLLRRVRGQDLQEVERADAVVAQRVPHHVVAGRPDDPGVAPLDLIRRERDRTVPGLVHVAEIVLVGGREARSGPGWTRLQRFVQGPCLLPDPASTTSGTGARRPARERPRPPGRRCGRRIGSR